MNRLLPTLLLAALAGGAGAANLSDVYRQARQNDAVYAAAEAAYRVGLEALPQGRALLYPSVALSASASRNETDSSASGSQSSNSHGYALSLSQPLYRKQNLETLEQAKLQVVQAEAQLKLARQDLMLRVARAYFDVLLAQDNLATAEAQKVAIAEQLALARKSFEVGAATIVDTHEAQARYDVTVAQEIAARNDLEVKRRAMEKLIQAAMPRLAALAGRAGVILPQPADMESWVRLAEADSLAVQVAQAAAEIASRELDKQRAGHLPTLDLAVSYADNRNGSVGGVSGVDSKSGSIGLAFAWSLYQGGAQESRIRAALAGHEQARANLDAVRRQAALDSRQAFLGVVSGDARVKALEQALVSSETQLKSTKLGLEVGVRTAVDVLNVQQQLFAAQRDLAAARYDALFSGLNLKAAAGGLEEADLAAVDGLLGDRPAP
jgi:outer membrane protein